MIHAASPHQVDTSRGTTGTTSDAKSESQTNSSSIVSKRSVEKLYYPSEPHFFRHFVTKFQRRSPLINRGYHLRLYVVDVVVRNFLRRPSTKTKVIVNLGCGRCVFATSSS